MNRSIHSTVLALALASGGGAFAQSPGNAAPADVPFVFGTVHTFRSHVLGQQRVLNIHLPEGYEQDTAAYPVVYVLDGSANEDFPHIAGLVQFMNMYDLFPKSIVVGIGNVDRRHDLTPPSSDTADTHLVPTAGGSAAFMDFLQQEVEPYVQANYRQKGERTIIGQSLGALFCVEVLFTRPELFDNYIIVSPSLWWDRGALAARADAFVRSHAHLAKRVYLSLGTEGDDMQAFLDRVIAAFRAHAGPELKWTYAPFPEESHATILHRSVYRAFEWLHTGK